jgi:hypothetical protein
MKAFTTGAPAAGFRIKTDKLVQRNNFLKTRNSNNLWKTA